MGKNVGKLFEEQFFKSVPDHVLLYRVPDPAQSFGRSSNLRFSRKNPFDFLLWDSDNHRLFALEMKTVGGKSISFERSKGESGVIHYYQIQGLNEWSKYDGIVCGFVIEFRGVETTVFIDIDSFNSLVMNMDKKSFNYSDLQNAGVPYIVIRQEKKKTRYRYDIASFLNEANERIVLSRENEKNGGISNNEV